MHYFLVLCGSNGAAGMDGATAPGAEVELAAWIRTRHRPEKWNKRMVLFHVCSTPFPYVNIYF